MSNNAHITADQVIARAAGEVGYHEGRNPDGHWNNIEKYAAQVPGLEHDNGVPWCAIFVSWCFAQLGALDLLPGGATDAVMHIRDAAMASGRFSQYPALGAVALFGMHGTDHCGLVESMDSSFITTIEGNTNTNGSPEGDGVYRKQHRRTDAWVYGYAYPDYVGGIVSADPSWAAQNPRPHHDHHPLVKLALSADQNHRLHAMEALAQHGAPEPAKLAHDWLAANEAITREHAAQHLIITELVKIGAR